MPSKILLSLPSRTRGEWKQGKNMERGFIPHDFETSLQVLHFCSPPFSCSIRYQKRKQGSGAGGSRRRERGEGALACRNTQKNYLLGFSKTGLEMYFSNYKMKKVSLVLMYLQQLSPISNSNKTGEGRRFSTQGSSVPKNTQLYSKKYFQKQMLSQLIQFPPKYLPCLPR